MPLVGGDVNVGENVVVRVGDTVRRPVGPHTEATSTRSCATSSRSASTERPASLGFDERGTQVLSFVEGEPALQPLPPDDDVLCRSSAALLRRMHDAQAGFDRASGLARVALRSASRRHARR